MVEDDLQVAEAVMVTINLQVSSVSAFLAKPDIWWVVFLVWVVASAVALKWLCINCIVIEFGNFICAKIGQNIEILGVG